MIYQKRIENQFCPKRTTITARARYFRDVFLFLSISINKVSWKRKVLSFLPSSPFLNDHLCIPPFLVRTSIPRRVFSLIHNTLAFCAGSAIVYVGYIYQNERVVITVCIPIRIVFCPLLHPSPVYLSFPLSSSARSPIVSETSWSTRRTETPYPSPIPRSLVVDPRYAHLRRPLRGSL